MAHMQSAHRGHERDLFAGSPPCGDLRPQIIYGSYDRDLRTHLQACFLSAGLDSRIPMAVRYQTATTSPTG